MTESSNPDLGYIELVSLDDKDTVFKMIYSRVKMGLTVDTIEDVEDIYNRVRSSYTG